MDVVLLLQACSKSYHPIFRFGENVVQNEADGRTPVTPTIDPFLAHLFQLCTFLALRNFTRMHRKRPKSRIFDINRSKFKTQKSNQPYIHPN